jgi:hypothetical protein
MEQIPPATKLHFQNIIYSNNSPSSLGWNFRSFTWFSISLKQLIHPLADPRVAIFSHSSNQSIPTIRTFPLRTGLPSSNSLKIPNYPRSSNSAYICLLNKNQNLLEVGPKPGRLYELYIPISQPCPRMGQPINAECHDGPAILVTSGNHRV